MSARARVFIVIVAVSIGARILAPSGQLVGALLGGLVALAACELLALRTRVAALDEEFRRLRQELQKNQQPAAAADTQRLPWREFDEPARPRAPQEPEPQRRDAQPGYAASTPPAPVRWLIEFFTGGNAVVRVGIVILFFGVAFLLRYLAEHTRVPIEWRLSGIVLGGVALLVVGWRLRSARRGYALALQGAGVGIFYLTVFAALRLYALLPAAVAFPILAAVAVLSALLAVLQNAQALALLGVTGGFLAPVLASNGQGSHVVLFSYYALLDAGILAVAWFKAWRPLNIAGFAFTFGIATVWGVLRYRPELFASTEPFLILYFLFYVTISVLFTLRQPVQLKGYIDGTLVFGTPIVVFALQGNLLVDRPMSLAYSALTMSALYLGLAWLLQRRRVAPPALLAGAFIGIGVSLLTLAVPLALDARWNVAAWSVEGTALIWLGCRQHRLVARLAGTLLILACGLIAATQFDLSRGGVRLPLVNYAGFVLLSLASLFAARTLQRYRQALRAFEPPLATALLFWGLWWWSAASLSEIAQFWPRQVLAGALLLLSFTTVVCSEIHRRTRLASARFAALLQLPLMLWVAFLAVGNVPHPAAGAGWLGWPLAFLTLYGLMIRHEGVARDLVANGLHAGATWLFCALASWELAFQIDRAVAGSDTWSTPAWVLLPTALLGLLPRLVTRVSWPFGKHRDAYLLIVGAGIALYLYAWSVMNLSASGDFAPLPYCPFLNPLDLAQAFVLAVLLLYWRCLRALRSPEFPTIDPKLLVPALAALTFLWLNAVLLRTLHQWFGVPYGWDALVDSTLVQTSLSIFWALLAFSLMLVATRRHRRTVWLVGASLLGVVIAKLFLVDLSRVGSIERIISFVGVGLLMLVIGYVSPLPPAREAR
jgi:uncharacterized membrane protein